MPLPLSNLAPAMLPLRHLPVLLTALFVGGLLAQQPDAGRTPAPILAGAPEHGVEGAQPGTERWIVHFAGRSFDLDGVRAAVHGKRPAAEIATLLADIDARMHVDQQGFVQDVQRLGGRVVRQWWIVNAAAIEIRPERVDAVRRLANVQFVEPDVVRQPTILESTNSANHNADVLQANGWNGQGATIAIIDSGQDVDMNGIGRPHRTYFPGGNPGDTSGGGIGGSRLLLNRQIGSQTADDVNGHGTGVASIAAGEHWGIVQADRGHAPRAGIAGYAIAEFLNGNTYTTTMASALQQVALDRVAYGIVAANMSYSGSSSPLGVEQQAMDSLALDFDVLCCQSAGNSGANTTASPSVANGLAVGAITHNTHQVPSFSAVGPLSGDPSRYYPDITGCGVDIASATPNLELAYYLGSGTSEASPQVAGAATQLRARFPWLTALQTKAILLASATDISAANPGLDRNSFGMGMLKNDRAHQLAASNNYGSGTVSTGSPNVVTIPVAQGRSYTIAIAWNRHDLASTNWSNLDLVVKNASTLQVLGSATSPRNLYEVVRVTPTFTGSLRLETTAVSLSGLGGGPQPFAWAWVETAPAHRDIVTYGTGCPGAGQPLLVCSSFNPAGGAFDLNYPIGGSPFAFQMPSAGNVTIDGIEILARDRFAPSPITVGIYTNAGSGPQPFPIASAECTAGTSPGYLRALFASPVTLQSGPYYVGISTYSTLDVTLAGGTPTNGYFWFNGSWQLGLGVAPSVRLLCRSAGTGAVPHFRIDGSNPGALWYGVTTNLRLSEGMANTIAVAAIGFAETDVSLQPFGAPCSLLMTADILYPVITDANGNAATILVVPSIPDSLWLEVYGQYGVLDPTNGLGISFSNGLRMTLGPN